MGRKRFFYGWIILAVSIIALIVSNGLAIGGIPVFYKFIREEFTGIGAIAPDRGESFIALGASITFMTAGFLSPLTGWLIGKFSIRYLMAAGCATLGAGLIILATTVSPPLVYFSRFLMGFSLCLVGVLPTIVLVSRWFIRRRGLALGILLTGTSIGGVLIPLAATPLIALYGWRVAMIGLSLVIWFVLLPLVWLLIKETPFEAASKPDGDTDSVGNIEERSPLSSHGLLLNEALRTPAFWIFAFAAALVFYPIFVTTQQFVLYLQSPRIGMSAAAGSIALAGIFFVSVSGKFFFGYLSDRFRPAKVMLVCALLMFAATLVLLRLTADNAFLFIIPFGFGYGGTFVLLQRSAADFFGNRDYARILSVLIVIETVGAAIGGLVTGRLADAANGDYSTSFYLVTAVTGLAALLIGILNLFFDNKSVLSARE